MLGKNPDSKPSCSEEIQLSRQEDSESHAPGSAQGMSQMWECCQERSWDLHTILTGGNFSHEVCWGLGEPLSASLSQSKEVSSCHEEGQCQWLHLADTVSYSLLHALATASARRRSGRTPRPEPQVS